MSSDGTGHQQDDGLHVWRPQPGLEYNSGQNDTDRSGDKQLVSSGRHVEDFHGDGKSSTPYQKTISRNPFGLSPLLFGLLVAPVTAIITGGAVGGGVGSQIKSSSSE